VVGREPFLTGRVLDANALTVIFDLFACTVAMLFCIPEALDHFPCQLPSRIHNVLLFQYFRRTRADELKGSSDNLVPECDRLARAK
jgi:hypothetical protein